jgi:hypothetical protein
MTAEEVRLEVNKLQKQMDDLTKNYCLSVSPYKIGDKVLDADGKLVIINEIKIYQSFFLQPPNYLYNIPFYYRVQELRKDGIPKVHGYRKMLMYLDEISGEVKITR